MKIALLILFTSSCLWADSESRSLQNLKEMQISLDMSSDVDAELLVEDVKEVDNTPPQEKEVSFPAKCHQAFFLKEKELPTK